MGGNHSTDNSRLKDEVARNLYITCDGYKELSGNFGPFKVFELTISHQRYTWKIYKRYNELVDLHSKIKTLLMQQSLHINPPKSKLKLVWKRHDKSILQKRGRDTALYLESLGTVDSVWNSSALREFLEISELSFTPELGRKGKCGYLKKVRGGLVSSWRWRLVVAHDSYIATYIPGKDGVQPSDVPEEVLRIDSGLVCVVSGRYLDIRSNSGRLSLCAYSRRHADEWKDFVTEFYNVNDAARTRKAEVPAGLCAFPSRCSLEEVEAFHCSRDYFHSLAVQLLNATVDIFITSAELSPTVLLTRPPLPPLRLDQILRFKANQGINIFIMINRDNNPLTASHNSTMTSFEVKHYLQNLSPRIKVIRITKNPVVGFQNEKVVVIDRIVAFTGSFDMNFGQYDDFAKSVEDEGGVKFPGHEYQQPCAGIMRPAKTVSRPVHHKKVFSPRKSRSSGARKRQQQAEEEEGQKEEKQQDQRAHSQGLGQEQEQEQKQEQEQSAPPLDSLAIVNEDDEDDEDNHVHSNNPDAPPHPLSMYQSTPFPFLQQPAGAASGNDSNAEMYGGMSSFRTANIEPSARASSQSVASQHTVADDHIGHRMNAMFADEEVDEAEDEAHLSSQSNLSLTLPGSAPSPQKKSSLSDSLFSVLATIGSGIEDAVTAFFQEEPFIDLREEHPRQPWHGVHVRVQGLTARDLSSHFVQKWRRHKTNSTQMNALVAKDITDDVYSSVCARCKCANLFEDVSVCPNCMLSLGRISQYTQAQRTSASVMSRCMPVAPEHYSFIVFECHFSARLGCLLHGNGPVAVEEVVNHPIDMSVGKLLFEQGPYANVLKARGLFPSIADVFLSVDYTDVTHLNFVELKRFYQRRSAIRRAENAPLSVTFRRHHVQSAVNTYQTFLDRLSVVQTSAEAVATCVSETAQVVSFEQPLVAVAQSAAAPTVAYPSTGSTGVSQVVLEEGSEVQGVSVPRPSGPAVDPVSGMLAHGAHRQGPQLAQAEAGGFVQLDLSEPARGAGQQAVVAGVDLIADGVPMEQQQQQQQAASAPYGGYYPSLDHIASGNQQHQQLEQQQRQPSWETQNQMWSNTGDQNGAANVEVVEEEEEEEESLEQYLRRHNIQMPVPAVHTTPTSPSDAVVEEEVNAEHNEEVNVDSDTLLVLDSTSHDDAATAHSNEVELGATDDFSSMSFPTAPSSTPAPPVVFPDAPSHDVLAVPSSASSRGLVGDSDPHGTQNSSKRKKEVAMSGRGGMTNNLSASGQQAPTNQSVDFGNQNHSPDPFSQVYDQDNHGQEFQGQYEMPTATTVDMDDDAKEVDEEPFKIQRFPFPPLHIPDEVFQTTNRLYACNEAIQANNNLSMSIVGHSISTANDKPDSRDVYPFDVHHPVAALSAGPLCQMQVLRGAGDWATGSRTETSIEEAWIKAIQSAQHLVYIENSHFISMPESSSKKTDSSRARSKSNAGSITTSLNVIAETLLIRLVAAATNHEQFRVIVILPQHSSGNFCDSHRYPTMEKTMALQYKGLQALLTSFQQQCPGVRVSEYIGFFSLRSWGIMNEKVVHSQVYVSSSVLIVDDRVAVVGGAGLSDQSLMGVHDSNIAMLIEDTTPVNIRLGGRPYEGSKFAHSLRMNLMRHHIGDNDAFSTDLADIANHLNTAISDSVSRQNSYDALWLGTANRNAELYSALDGDYSIYGIKSLEAFKKMNAKDNYIHKSELDAQVQHILGGVQGFLVPFPLDFKVS